MTQRVSFIGRAPGLSSELAEAFAPEDSLPACVSDRDTVERLERRISRETSAELREVLGVLRRYRLSAAIALVEAELSRRGGAA